MLWQSLTVLAFILLVPLAPAYILYRTLPSKTSVKGPFKGLSIQLSGAFAAYFVLVLFSSGTFYYLQKSMQPVLPFVYILEFPENKYPGDLSDTDVEVHVKRAGQGKWILLKDIDKTPTNSGIMVSVKDVSTSDVIYISAKYLNDEWETVISVTVPVDHLLLRTGHQRKDFP